VLADPDPGEVEILAPTKGVPSFESTTLPPIPPTSPQSRVAGGVSTIGEKGVGVLYAGWEVEDGVVGKRESDNQSRKRNAQPRIKMAAPNARVLLPGRTLTFSTLITPIPAKTRKDPERKKNTPI